MLFFSKSKHQNFKCPEKNSGRERCLGGFNSGVKGHSSGDTEYQKVIRKTNTILDVWHLMRCHFTMEVGI